MGNHVGVCREPPQLAELFPLQDEPPIPNGNDHMQDDGGFRSYIQMWRFYSDNGDDMFIKNSPVKLGAFKKFDSRDCYIALHVFKNIGDTNKHSSLNPHHPPPDTPYSLHELVISSIEELTPRGIASSFGTLSLEPFIHTSREEYTHDLYVWNGKASTPLAKAVALAKGFEIERVLVKEKSSSGTVYHRFARGPKSSLSSIFRDDIDESGGRSPHDRRYDMNHLFRQLLSPYKRTSTIKIGELFGHHQADSPRFEVLRKSIHKFEPGSSSPSVSRSKVPSLPLHALPPPSHQQQLDDATPRPKAHTDGSINVPSFTRRMTLSFDNLKDPNEYNEDDYSTWEPSKLLTRFEPLLSQILDFLYLSSRIPTADKQMLKTNGVTHILNCAGNACTNHFPEDFVYKTYFISDSSGEDIMCLFYETIDYIEEARLKGGKVLVHCHQGVSRSSSFVILYLMWQFRWDFNKAHEWVRAIRYISNPNPGFTGQLILWFNMISKLPSRPRPNAIPPPNHPPPSAVPPSLVLATPRSSMRGEPISTPRIHREPPSTPRSISFDSAITTRSNTPGSPTPTPNFSSTDPTPTPRGEPPARFNIPTIPISSIPSINAPAIPTLQTQKVTPLHFNLSIPTPGEPPPHRRSNDSPPTSPTLYLHQPKTLTRTASDPTPSSSSSPPMTPPPTKLFRMVSHSQNSFVAPKTVAEPYTCRALDPRGCFALCTPTVVFLWYGARCPSALADGARRAVDKLQRYEFAASSVEDVRQGHEPPAFWACVPGGSGEVVENPAYREYLQVGAQSPGRRELTPPTNGSPERAQFYKYLEDKDSWDRYECFDLEDLDPEGMFVVYVQQPRHIWVWIGGDYVGRWGVDGESVDGLLVARQFRNFLALSDEGDVTIIKHVQQETEEFMSNFHWGDAKKE